MAACSMHQTMQGMQSLARETTLYFFASQKTPMGYIHQPPKRQTLHLQANQRSLSEHVIKLARAPIDYINPQKTATIFKFCYISQHANT